MRALFSSLYVLALVCILSCEAQLPSSSSDAPEKKAFKRCLPPVGSSDFCGDVSWVYDTNTMKLTYLRQIYKYHCYGGILLFCYRTFHMLRLVTSFHLGRNHCVMRLNWAFFLCFFEIIDLLLKGITPFFSSYRHILDKANWGWGFSSNIPISLINVIVWTASARYNLVLFFTALSIDCIKYFTV